MLKNDTIEIMHECNRGSLDGALRFPQVVRKLNDAGVEGYHADLYRHEKTYYMPSGESHVAAQTELTSIEVADPFSEDGVRAALGAIQQGKTSYIEFMQQIAAAGVAHYWVFLKANKTIYVGRRGESWTEVSPAPPK